MHLPLTIFAAVVIPFNDAHLFVVYLGMVASLHLMQMAHRWAHLPEDRVPTPVRWLQRARLLIGKPAHDAHHDDPFDKNFCIMTGMFNRPLNWVVKNTSRFSHAWIAVFLLTSLIPAAIALTISWT